MFDKMTHDEWTTCLAPKVQGTWNLHNATEGLNLDFFILVGSVSGVCGTPGQANYAAANSFLGSFTTYRRNLGLPAGIVDLGAIEDVGMLAKNPELIQKAQSFSLCFPTEQQLIDGLKLALSQCASPAPTESNQSTSCIIGLSNTKPLSNPNTRPLWVRQDSRFSLYTNLESQSSEPVQGQSNELRSLLRRVEHNPSLLNDPTSEAIVRREIGSQVTQRMVQAQDMDEDEIAAIAIDSLMAIEIRGWARRNLGLEITLVQIAKAKTVGGLTKAAIEHLKVKYGVDEAKGGDEGGKGEQDEGRQE
jgi:acyl carrier protein